MKNFQISRGVATTLYLLLAFAISFLYSGGCSAQTSKATFAKTINLDKLDNLEYELENVEFVAIKGSRVIVERTISVTHSKSDAVLRFISHNVDGFHVTKDNLNDTLSLQQIKDERVFTVNGEDAEVHEEYRVYVPEHIKLLQKT